MEWVYPETQNTHTLTYLLSPDPHGDKKSESKYKINYKKSKIHNPIKFTNIMATVIIELLKDFAN